MVIHVGPFKFIWVQRILLYRQMPSKHWRYQEVKIGPRLMMSRNAEGQIKLCVFFFQSRKKMHEHESKSSRWQFKNMLGGKNWSSDNWESYSTRSTSWKYQWHSKHRRTPWASSLLWNNSALTYCICQFHDTTVTVQWHSTRKYYKAHPPRKILKNLPRQLLLLPPREHRSAHTIPAARTFTARTFLLSPAPHKRPDPSLCYSNGVMAATN